ncbi:unnamed protein product [Trifolium pratense]|uniref:Uncharacterized protein n=1 Tax=Trifolium pratense TaxID=57577 RepID=A0ACB0ISX5_TRIPR|nr:unnamed protein product [Trifolium pratense]
MLNMPMVVISATLVIFLLCSYPSVATTLLNKLQLPSPVTGPESPAFDRNGGGPYVSSSDGRIFKYVGPTEGFIEYASTSPNRNKTVCDGLADFSAAQATCGRPLGLGDFETPVNSVDKSGSLLKYDPSTNETTVLLSNLAVPSGEAVSRDGSFLLVSEYLANRIQRVWRKGPNANSSELFMLLAGRPDNIKRNSIGDFWISVNSFIGSPRSPRRAIFPGGFRVTEDGLILQKVSLALHLSMVLKQLVRFKSTMEHYRVFYSHVSLYCYGKNNT